MAISTQKQNEMSNLETKLENKEESNNKDITCTLCGSLVLRTNVGLLQNEPTFDIPLMFQKSDYLKNLDKKMETEKISKWVCVTDMFAFENVGFSHPYEGRKFLICADCELGPIGVFDEPNNKYLIALSRIILKN